MADDYSFLAGLSANPNRPGDTSNFNPAFARNLASAIREAKANGLNVGVESGYRNPLELSKQGNPNANFDAAGNSLHSYGLAADVNGIGAPGSATAKQWASIAAKNGLYNPYDPNGSEWNHWQALPFTLTQRGDVKAALSNAAATGDFKNVWAAANPYLQGGTATASSSPAPINPGLTINSSPLAGSHSQFIQDYARSIGLDPKLALGIANAEGLKAWSASNPNAASTVDVQGGQPFSFGDFQLNIHPGAMGAKAIAAGIDPRDPKQWQAADKFALDQMKAGGVSPWKGDPVAAAYLKSGTVPSTVDTSAPATTGTSLTSSPAAASSSGVLPGFGTADASNQFLQGLDKFDKSLGGRGLQQDGAGAGQAQQPDIRPVPIMQGPGLRNYPGPAGVEAQARQLEPQLTHYSPGLYGQSLNSQPLSWSSAPVGPPSWLTAAGPQQPQGLGTSLNSLQAMDPQMYAQRMAMLYGTGGDFGGGYG